MLIVVAALTVMLLMLLVCVWLAARRDETGIYSFVLAQTARKNKNKAKIIELLEEKDEISNEEIRTELKVSRQTAVRYMDQLEKAGKVRQVGKTGRSVVYRLNDPTG